MGPQRLHPHSVTNETFKSVQFSVYNTLLGEKEAYFANPRATHGHPG